MNENNMKIFSWILAITVVLNSAFYMTGIITDILHFKLNYINYLSNFKTKLIFFHTVRTSWAIFGLSLFYFFVRNKKNIGIFYSIWWIPQLIKIDMRHIDYSGQLLINPVFDLIVGFSIAPSISPSSLESLKSNEAIFIGINIIAIVGCILSIIKIDAYNKSAQAGAG